MAAISSLHRFAFDKNAQASVIATVAGGRIVAGNSAACDLLGYTPKAILTKSWLSLFRPGETSFKKLLGHVEATGQGHGLVCVTQKNGNVICCDITIAKFRDGDGIERSVTMLSDRSGSIRLQKKIDTQNKKVVAENISIAKTKQKKIDTRNNQTVAYNIKIAKKTVAENISIAKTKQKKIDTRNNQTVAHNIEVAKKTVAENIKLAQTKSDNRFNLIFNSSSDVLYDIDLVTNQIVLSDGYEKEFGYPIKDNMSPVADWADHIHPEDKEAVIKDYMAMLDTKKNRMEVQLPLPESGSNYSNGTQQWHCTKKSVG